MKSEQPKAWAIATVMAVLAFVSVVGPSSAIEFEVTSVSPSPNGIADTSTPISVSFSSAIIPASVTPRVFWAMGRLSGPIHGQISISDEGRTAVLTPSRPLIHGDLILVLVGNSVRSVDGRTLRPAGHSFQFWSSTQPAVMQFQEVGVLSTGIRPYGGSAGDFDLDGFLDLAIVNEDSDNMMIFPNAADRTGTFAPHLEPPIDLPNRPSPSETGDFDRDGILDMCVGSLGDGSITVLLGDGQGNLLSHDYIDTQDVPRAVVVLDADGDGDLDIAESGGKVVVLLNDGQGFFPTIVALDVDSERSLATADINNDGILDLIAGQTSNERIAVMLGTGNPFEFADSVALYDVGDQPKMITIGDLDGDGYADLATANRVSGSILMNNGDGTLAEAVHYCDHDTKLCDVALPSPRPVASDLGDLDGDGNLDWALSNLLTDLQILRNDGTGVFSPVQVITPAGGAECSIFLDSDNNGTLDVAVIDENDDSLLVTVNPRQAIFSNGFEFLGTFFWSETFP